LFVSIDKQYGCFAVLVRLLWCLWTDLHIYALDPGRNSEPFPSLLNLKTYGNTLQVEDPSISG
jgi:hypothetical protein